MNFDIVSWIIRSERNRAAFEKYGCNMSFRRFASLTLAMLKRDSFTMGLSYNVIPLSYFVPLRKILEYVSRFDAALYK